MFPSPSLVILHPHLLALKNRLFRKDLRSRQEFLRDVLLIAVALLVMGCIFFGVTLVLSSTKNNVIFQTIIPGKLIELLFYTLFFLLIVSDTVSVIGNIYSSENMNLLLTTPLPPVSLYLGKLSEIVIETSLMLVVFGIPAVFAYCYALSLPLSFLLNCTVVTFFFLLIPAGLGMVLGTLFVHAACLFWHRGFFFLLCLLGIFGWGILKIIGLMETVRLEHGGINAIIQLIGLFDNPNPLWVPSRWAADLLSSSVGSTSSHQLEKAMLLVTSAIGSVAIGYLVFDLFCLRVRSTAGTQSHLSGEKKKHSTDLVRKLLESFLSLFPCEQQTRAIILKDLSSLVRDRAQALQLLLYLGIAVIYIVILKFMGDVMNLSPVGTQLWWAFLASINTLFAGFILTALMTRLVYPSISLEGRAFWILQVTPISTSKLIRIKFWCWFPLICFISLTLLLSGILAIGLDLATATYTAVLSVILSGGFTGLAIGFGAIFAIFEWESPSQIASGFGTLALLLVSLLLVVLSAVISSTITSLVAVPALRLKIGLIWSFLIMSSALFSLIVLHALVTRLAFKLGTKSLEEL